MSIHFKSFQSWGFSKNLQKPIRALIVLFHFIPIDPANPAVLQFQHWLSMNQQECGRCSQKCPVQGKQRVLVFPFMAGCFKNEWEDFFSRGNCQIVSGTMKGLQKQSAPVHPWHPQLDLFSGEFAGYWFIAWFFSWFQNGGNMDNHILGQFCHKSRWLV